MHHGGVNGHGFLGRDVRTILQVVVLTLLLCLEVQSGKTTQVFLADGFVNLEEERVSLNFS
jgi:hypothetical protein